MASDTHIKFFGIEGEATHAEHKGEIEVLSWSWGVANVGGVAGGGSGKGKADGADFSFMHLYDKASPNLAKKCAQGVHFPEVTVTSRKAGDGQKDFLKITMKEVFVSSVQQSASAGGEITEAVSMSYGSIDFAYKPQDSSGKLGGEVKFGWDVKTTVIT